MYKYLYSIIYLSKIKLFITALAIFSNISYANESPNICSRDKHENAYTLIGYHEIADKSETLDPTYTVSPENFALQIEWLIKDGYHFVNVDDIIEYRKNGKHLPDHAVLITFDDGYKSVYQNAYPILKKYHIPFVIALVGSWLQDENQVDFAGNMISRDKFMSQNEIKEMVSSGLAEVASHSYNSHFGIVGNPQGNMEAALTTRAWFADKQAYEDETNYRHRIYLDLLKNNTFLEAYTGQKPRVMVWPYGNYNLETRQIAEQLGMPVGITLDDGSNTAKTPLWGLRRILVEGDMTHLDVKKNMMMRNANFTDDAQTTKGIQVDLDRIYDPDPVTQEKNLGVLLDRLQQLGVNTVYLKAFTDLDGNGAADAVYFRNKIIPMRADLFNRVAWQIATRTQVERIYALMPVLAWQLPKLNKASSNKVVSADLNSYSHSNPRLSPFSEKARKTIEQIYLGLARSVYIDGVLFDDDMVLSKFEDDSVDARQQYSRWGLHKCVRKIQANKNEFSRLTVLKTQYLDHFAMHLAHIVRDEQPGLLLAHKLNAQTILNKNMNQWYSQALDDSIKKYDYTIVMATPYSQEAHNRQNFYENLAINIKKQQCGLARTVLELQTADSKNDMMIPSQEIIKGIDYLYDLGIGHIAYSPDDILHDNPNTSMISEVFSHKPIQLNLASLEQYAASITNDDPNDYVRNDHDPIAHHHGRDDVHGIRVGHHHGYSIHNRQQVLDQRRRHAAEYKQPA